MGPLPLAALRTSFDLPNQQVDGPVNVVGLDVPDDGVEEGPDLLVVRRSQRSLLLHWKEKMFQSKISPHSRWAMELCIVGKK